MDSFFMEAFRLRARYFCIDIKYDFRVFVFKEKLPIQGLKGMNIFY